eukprot:g1769.t1
MKSDETMRGETSLPHEQKQGLSPPLHCSLFRRLHYFHDVGFFIRNGFFLIYLALLISFCLAGMSRLTWARILRDFRISTNFHISADLSYVGVQWNKDFQCFGPCYDMLQLISRVVFQVGAHLGLLLVGFYIWIWLKIVERKAKLQMEPAWASPVTFFSPLRPRMEEQRHHLAAAGDDEKRLHTEGGTTVQHDDEQLYAFRELLAKTRYFLRDGVHYRQLVFDVPITIYAAIDPKTGGEYEYITGWDAAEEGAQVVGGGGPAPVSALAANRRYYNVTVEPEWRTWRQKPMFGMTQLPGTKDTKKYLIYVGAVAQLLFFLLVQALGALIQEPEDRIDGTHREETGFGACDNLELQNVNVVEGGMEAAAADAKPELRLEQERRDEQEENDSSCKPHRRCFSTAEVHARRFLLGGLHAPSSCTTTVVWLLLCAQFFGTCWVNVYFPGTDPSIASKSALTTATVFLSFCELSLLVLLTCKVSAWTKKSTPSLARNYGLALYYEPSASFLRKPASAAREVAWHSFLVGRFSAAGIWKRRRSLGVTSGARGCTSLGGVDHVGGGGGRGALLNMGQDGGSSSSSSTQFAKPARRSTGEFVIPEETHQRRGDVLAATGGLLIFFYCVQTALFYWQRDNAYKSYPYSVVFLTRTGTFFPNDLLFQANTHLFCGMSSLILILFVFEIMPVGSVRGLRGDDNPKAEAPTAHVQGLAHFFRYSAHRHCAKSSGTMGSSDPNAAGSAESPAHKQKSNRNCFQLFLYGARFWMLCAMLFCPTGCSLSGFLLVHNFTCAMALLFGVFFVVLSTLFYHAYLFTPKQRIWKLRQKITAPSKTDEEGGDATSDYSGGEDGFTGELVCATDGRLRFSSKTNVLVAGQGYCVKEATQLERDSRNQTHDSSSKIIKTPSATTAQIQRQPITIGQVGRGVGCVVCVCSVFCFGLLAEKSGLREFEHSWKRDWFSIIEYVIIFGTNIFLLVCTAEFFVHLKLGIVVD